MSHFQVLKRDIAFIQINDNDYISLTDIAKYKDGARTDDLIRNWIRNRNTVEFLGLWESIYNLNFNPVEFDGFRKQAGLNSFLMTPKQWIKKTGAIGVISKPGRYGGTFAHKDIAFEFATWISMKFKLYLIKEFQRLKKIDSYVNKLDWDVRRSIAKINYAIHLDAIKLNLIPKILSTRQTSYIYSCEADILNVALFGMSAKEWKCKNKTQKGNIRDYSSISQLICLSNLESINSVFIKDSMSQVDRMRKLNSIAIDQMRQLIKSQNIIVLGDKK